MADNFTPIYNFVLPEPGGSDFTWGFKLNSNFSLIENTLDKFGKDLNVAISQLDQKYAKTFSPTFTGLPQAPTQNSNDNSKLIATTEFVQKVVALNNTNFRGSAPPDLDTFEEIARAINNDPNFFVTVSDALAKKANIDSPTLTGIPRAPQPALNNYSDQIATTKFVRDYADQAVQNSAQDLSKKANIDSPSFTGVPRSITFTPRDRSDKIATTKYVDDADDALESKINVSLTNLDSKITTLTGRVAQAENNINLKADNDSPTLTGTPKSTTPAVGDNSTRIATTFFVNKAVADAIQAYANGNTPAPAPTQFMLRVQDEGNTITTGATSLNFTGAGVTATATGSNVTINVAGGGAGGSVTPSANFAVAFGNGNGNVKTTQASPPITPAKSLFDLGTNIANAAAKVSLPLFFPDMDPVYLQPQSQPYRLNVMLRDENGDTSAKRILALPSGRTGTPTGFGNVLSSSGPGGFAIFGQDNTQIISTWEHNNSTYQTNFNFLPSTSMYNASRAANSGAYSANGFGVSKSINFDVEGTTIMAIDRNSGGGFGVAGSSGALVVYNASIVPVNGVLDIGSATNRWRTAYLINNANISSDKRIKYDFDKSLGLDFVCDLNPVSYKVKGIKEDSQSNDLVLERYTEDGDGKTHQGLIAQDVKEALIKHGIDPEKSNIWEKDKNTEDGLESLRYEQLIAPLINSVKELSQTVNTQKTLINELIAVVKMQGEQLQQIKLMHTRF